MLFCILLYKRVSKLKKKKKNKEVSRTLLQVSEKSSKNKQHSSLGENTTTK